MDLKDFFRHWEEVHQVTLRVLKAIPQDKLDFKPTESMMSAKDLVKHMLVVEKTFSEGVKKGSLAIEDFKKFGQVDHKDSDELINAFDQVHKEMMLAHSKKTEKELKEIIKTEWGDSPAFNQLRGAYEHLWHHRGQLYVYLRLMRVEPPFVFGYRE
jgi:uncharacterized damage-inducible protein DinB